MTNSDLREIEVAKEIDCIGEACPGPVLKAMEALGEVEAGEVVVLKTDVSAAVQNVRVAVETGGLAEALGTLEEDELFFLYLKRNSD